MSISLTTHAELASAISIQSSEKSDRGLNLKKIMFTLDDERLEVEAGTTILEAAESKGIFIPTFCHLKELKPKSSCFICVVEVEGTQDLLPSCSTAVEPGMVVRTHSSRVDEARQSCVELLLSDHLGDCLGPCMTACPAGIDIPGFISHLADGDDRAALELIKRNMPLPGILGRICKRPCEDACRRQLVEKQMAICHLKRYAADTVADSGDEYIPRRATSNGKKVAVVGAGPSGLTVAYYLQLLGYSCTIFDSHNAPGGMLRYGIPSFRLPAAVINHEVAVLEKLGSEFKLGVSLGDDLTLSELRVEYDAVFLGIGAQQALRLGVEGEDADGVLSCLDFLAKKDNVTSVSGKTIVIGGGDVAVDAARVAIRKGASAVHVYCLEKLDEMPAGDLEVEEALQEGISIHNGFGVKAVTVKDGAVCGVEFKKCVSVFDENGVFNPKYDEEATTKDTCESLIVAIGQTVNSKPLSQVSKLGLGLIASDPNSMQTNLKDVFSGGDCVTGPSNAVNAVAAGRRAAIAIDQFVTNGKVVGDSASYEHSMGPIDRVSNKTVEKFVPMERTPMPCLEAKKRVASFDEVETGFTQEMVREEARRCMACGCRDAHECKLRAYATLFGAEGELYQGDCREYDLDESHPEIIYEANKCIQCRTCVRITEEILGTSSMQVVGRGFTSRVKPVDGGEMALVKEEGILQIVDNCPVGALTRKGDPVPTLDPVFRRPGVTC
jgi:NADPH-dependent glutamate synthase beta subunit-like oxidoreductase/ferredoxin